MRYWLARWIERMLLKAAGLSFSWRAAAVTLLLGFVPFLVLSLSSGTFWPHSRVNVPLTLSPSILLGDSMLIPLFNGLAFPVLITFLRGQGSRRHRIVQLASAALTLSVGLNCFLHVVWSRDAYTGFIDPIRGKLSLGGWWHCAFASLELLFVSVFLMASFAGLNKIDLGPILRAWSVFVLYTALSIFDAIVMFSVVGRPVQQMGLPDLIAMSPVGLAGTLYILLRLRVRPEPLALMSKMASSFEVKRGGGPLANQEQEIQALVQLHLAEYNALTNRCTYRMYFQFSIWGVLLIYFPLIGLAWHGGLDHAFILWVSAVVVQGAVFLWQENLIEIYRSIQYIEQVQRPLLVAILPGKQFWEYERYLAGDRPTRPVWWEYLFPLLAFFAIAGVTAFRLLAPTEFTSGGLHHWKDLLGFGINILLFVVLLYSTAFAVKIRRSMTTKQPPQSNESDLVKSLGASN